MLRVVAVIAVLLAAPAAAHAQTEQIVGLLDVRADGVGQVVRDRFAEAVEEGLAGSADFTPATRERMLQMLANTAWSPACMIGPCLAEVRAQTGAQYVVIAGVSGTGQSYRMTITLIETAGGTLVGQVTETCPACTVEDVASSATLSTIELINAAPTVATGGDGDRPQRPDRGRDHARTVRRTAVLFLGSALLAGAAGLYFLEKDRDDVSYPLLGAAGGLAVSGAVMLGLSFRF
jgi:hypothetical protein